ncbi:MAG: hypothetical protein M1540_04140 [Candidatus Bathyarchaeota archaeon]|nr:hypothetical protein [Candidatus Bathyarchaeota archaeon]
MHKRSTNKLLQRKIRRIIQHSTYYDKQKGETISTATQSEILDQLKEPIEVCLVPDIEKGEVLLDPKGKGSLQQK